MWVGMARAKEKPETTLLGGIKMKKVLSTLVAALVAVSFAGIVCAAEPAPAPAAAPEVKKEEKAPVVKKAKKKKAKKAKKAEVKKEEAPAAPAAPAAK